MSLRISEALTFDDVLIKPGYSSVLPTEVDLKTRLSVHITLNIPLISAAMDTVTESRLAISMAQEGGIGIIHKNMSIEEQAKEVHVVKKYESGIVKDPITIAPTETIEALLELTDELNISGLPVVEDGRLVGIITNRDVRFASDLSKSVREMMTPKDALITASENVSKEQIITLMHQHRVEKILLINDAFELKGLVTEKDIHQASKYPNACKDDLGRLRVGASVGIDATTHQRVKALVASGVDLIVVDTAHGHSRSVIATAQNIRKDYPDLTLVAGNVATAEGALALADVGVDAVKVGIGPGSICTTRIVTGVGVPQISAIQEIAQALNGRNIPIIADGGVRYSGDIAKAIVAGAHVVMIGSLLAGTEEAPGEIELYQGRTYKAYRGMGSLAAMGAETGSADRYFQADIAKDSGKLVPEGIEGRVPYRGLVSSVVHQLTGGLRAAMGYTGSESIETLRVRPEFVRISNASMRESHVHDVEITKEAPNYPSL